MRRIILTEESPVVRDAPKWRKTSPNLAQSLDVKDIWSSNRGGETSRKYKAPGDQLSDASIATDDARRFVGLIIFDHEYISKDVRSLLVSR